MLLRSFVFAGLATSFALLVGCGGKIAESAATDADSHPIDGAPSDSDGGTTFDCPPGSDPACSACIQTSCGSQLSACENGPCTALITCLQANACNGNACSNAVTSECNACLTSLADDCIAETCGAACSASSDAGTPPSESCAGCAAAACPSELTACQGDTLCNADIACVNACNGDAACVNACVSNECGVDAGTSCSPSGDLFNDLITCLGTNCNANCFGG